MPRTENIENIARRKKQILKAAVAAFARTGLKGTSMDDIVHESGMSKGAIYWYYKSKDEIITELINFFFDPNEMTILDQMLSTGSAIERIEKLVEYSAKEMNRMKPFRPVIQELYVIAFRDAKIKKMAMKSFQASTDLIERIIEYGIKHKEFRRVDPHQISVALIEMMEGAAILWFIDARNNNYGKQVRDGISLIIDAIKVDK